MFGFEQLTRDLAQAWRTGGTTPLPEAGKGPTTRLEAYAIQDRMAELIGEPVVGWKVGATAPAIQLFEGHDGPIPGRIFADRCFESPARVPADLLNNVKMECEFAFRTTQAIPAGSIRLGTGEIAESLTFHPAFELAASRYAPGTGNRSATTFDGIADNGSGGAAIIGPPVERWRDLSFETMEIETSIDGSPAVQIFTGAYRRDPVAIVVETFSDLRARGIAIAAGSYVLTGSLSVPTTVRKGQTVTAKFAGMSPLTFTMT
ncbi:MAG: putative Hydratase/decarboxylase [Tardiphaga sp.]|jgi:2-keto-4-pentenoate hydratase|nr:putative Hydratase/decarboxylase [Tardiphaga sp.]